MTYDFQKFFDVKRQKKQVDENHAALTGEHTLVLDCQEYNSTYIRASADYSFLQLKIAENQDNLTLSKSVQLNFQQAGELRDYLNALLETQKENDNES